MQSIEHESLQFVFADVHKVGYKCCHTVWYAKSHAKYFPKRCSKSYEKNRNFTSTKLASKESNNYFLLE